MSKIYELAEQAAEHAVVNPSEMNLESELDGVKVVIPKEFIDKFAELLVRECLDVVKLAHSEGNEDAYSYDDALDHVEYNIKQHFGVEE